MVILKRVGRGREKEKGGGVLNPLELKRIMINNIKLIIFKIYISLLFYFQFLFYFIFNYSFIIIIILLIL